MLSWALETRFAIGYTAAVSRRLPPKPGDLAHIDDGRKQVPLDKVGEQAGLVRPGRHRKRHLDGPLLQVCRVRTACPVPYPRPFLLADMANAVGAALPCADPPIPDERLERAHKVGKDRVDMVEAGQQLDDVGTRVRVLLGQYRDHKGA